jgi:CubicO group peptidase (beta-lactamase class C family)
MRDTLPMKTHTGYRQSPFQSGVEKPSRRKLIRSIGISLSALTLDGIAGDSSSARKTNPGSSWERFARPEDAGFHRAGLDILGETLFTKPTTSLLVVKSGRIVYSYGDTSHVSYLASARKSVLSMLYGNYVANGKIDLNKTVGDLGIDEPGQGLFPIEKTATVRHLLMSSSVFYWPDDSSSTNPSRSSRHWTAPRFSEIWCSQAECVASAECVPSSAGVADRWTM